MFGDDEPWIVTDGRVPCLVIEGEIKNSVGMEKINSELTKSFAPIWNVYNRTAYQMDDACEVAFCISKSGRAALLFVGMKAKPADDPATAIMDYVRSQQNRIQSFFSSKQIGTIAFDRFGFEMTGKNPN